MIALSGCVDGFRGSNVLMDMSFATPAQTPAGATPRPNQLPTNSHYRFYAIKEETNRENTFELQRFEVHGIIDPTSPCYIDIGEHVPFPGLHVSQYRAKVEEVTGITDISNPPPNTTQEQRIDAATAIVRMQNIAALAGDMGIKVVTSASAGDYPPVDADCNGGGLPPRTCIDTASNARRLAACQAAWAADPLLYEGTDRVLTAPLNGTTFGFVVGLNPINLAPVGGAQFFVDEALGGTDEYAIYFQTDGVEDDLGTLILSGRPRSPTRGVRHVHMTSPSSPNITADLAVFEDLGEDDTHF
ncbi:MAG: hypothetical protein M4D80_26350 [Myxococcota bacterium]|nr:hypothetical protein [Deltaproteobacteria bacterium]MDQ3338702.1 hypothetical protein [Myxococcota bacterium]